MHNRNGKILWKAKKNILAAFLKKIAYRLGLQAEYRKAIRTIETQEEFTDKEIRNFSRIAEVGEKHIARINDILECIPEHKLKNNP